MAPNEKTAKGQRGRPSSYMPEFAAQAEKLCIHGFTDEELADFFDVSRMTIHRWASDYPKFREAMKDGKALSDDRVKRSLYHKAVGYSFEAVKIMQVGGEVQQIPYKEHIPPDTTAAIFWLKNRDRMNWRDKQEVEHSGVLSLAELVSASYASGPQRSRPSRWWKLGGGLCASSSCDFRQ